MLGVVSAYHPAWVADAMRWVGGAGRRPGPLLGRRRRRCSASRATSTRWRSTARSRAGSASSTAATRRRTWRSRSRALIAIGLVVPTDVKLLAGIYAFGATLAITIAHLSIVRLRVTDPERAAARSAFPGTSPGAGRELPAAGALRRAAQRARLPQRPRLPRPGALGRRRLDGLRPRLLRRLPQARRGDVADQAGLGHRAGADQAGARGRLPQHPRAGLRHRARRRHRRHRGAARRRPSRRSERRGGGIAARRWSTWSRCR